MTVRTSQLLAVAEVLLAITGGCIGVLGVWTYRGDAGGMLADSPAGLLVVALFWMVPGLVAVGHALSGYRALCWVPLAVAIVQTMIGMLTFVGEFMLPGLLALSASACAFQLDRRENVAPGQSGTLP